MPSTRWGEAILRLLSERHWTRRHLARRAKLQPKTLTNLLRYGRHADTVTLTRIAAAFEVDLVELFATSDQATLLRTFRERHVPIAAAQFFSELETAVKGMVSRGLAGEQRADVEKVVDDVLRRRPRRQPARARKRRPRR